MNTLQINGCLKGYKNFCGTYARDRIPNMIPKNTGIVVNTDDSSKPGEHWVAIFNYDVAIYFDSFGLPPMHKEIIDFLDKISPFGWFHNSVTFQGLKSNTCGMYCVYFLKTYFKGKNFNEFRITFNKTQNENDLLVEKLYKM